VKYVLTRSSEFQENRRKFRRKEIPRQKYQINSTKNPTKQISAQKQLLQAKTAKDLEKYSHKRKRK